MSMQSIDNTIDMMCTASSRTWMGGWQIDDSLRTRMSHVRRLVLAAVAICGNAQIALTREKRHCESQRKRMFPHFFSCTSNSLRTSFPESGSQSTSCDGLWAVHVGMGALFWTFLHETSAALAGESIAQPGSAGSTFAGAPPPSKATAKTPRVFCEPGSHTMTLTSEFYGKTGGVCDRIHCC